MSSVALLFIAGSLRQRSYNRMLAARGAEVAIALGHKATVADLNHYPLPLYDGDSEAADGPPDAAVRLEALFRAHTGIFIASPEYNASISPLLKNTLDWLSRVRPPIAAAPNVFTTRVFALGAASSGGTGGLRGLMALRPILELGLGALVLPNQVLVARAATAFDTEGRLANAETETRLAAVIEKLARAAHVLHG